MITKVYLLNVPLDRDYKHTLYFTSESTQNEYFQSRIVKSYTDFSYQRKDSVIRVPALFDEIERCNYVMYKNRSKWYYAFITDMKYIHDERTDITIETDAIQTWMFNCIIRPSFVEREHVSDDSVGKHTIPEGLECGEYVIQQHIKDDHFTLENLHLVVGSTESPSGEGVEIGGTYNGVYSGAKYYTYDSENMTTCLQYLADNTKENAVSSVFYAPKFILPSLGGGPIANSNTASSYEMGIPKITALGKDKTYTPKNKKLLTSPYCYLLVSNGNGASAIFNQEEFSDTNCTFKIIGALTPSCSIRMYPTNYKGSENNIDEGVNLGKLPQCNWATDMYTNWLTQNGVNIATNAVGSVGSMVMGTAMLSNPATAGMGVTSIASGLAGVANSVSQQHLGAMVPPQTFGNTNCGDVMTSSGENTFHTYKMTIKDEYGKIIDDYFNAYGYKVNRVKVPNKCHRGRWWYTKTIDINIDGAIPGKDLQVIKDCYNRGITFWRNGSEIGDYNLSNSIAITDGAVTDAD